VGGSALSWASPLGWASQTAPYVYDRWWPLALLVLLGVVCVAGAFALQARRDLGASMIAVRGGRVDAVPWLGTPFGLATRLQRGAVIGWGAVIVLFGLIDGVFAQAMLDAADQMPPLLLEVFGTEGLEAGYIAFLSSFSGYVTAAYVVFAVQGLVTEEARGRAEIILATPTSRAAWAGSHFAVVALGSALILLVTGLVTGVAIGAVTGTWSAVPDSTWAHLNMIPAALVVVGVSAAVFGWAPRLLAIVGWALVGVIIPIPRIATVTKQREIKCIGVPTLDRHRLWLRNTSKVRDGRHEIDGPAIEIATVYPSLTVNESRYTAVWKSVDQTRGVFEPCVLERHGELV